MGKSKRAMPLFDKNGNLNPGVHKVTLDDIKASFIWSDRRRFLYEGLVRALESLRNSGIRQVYIDGSFTTIKEEPGDIDGCWVPNEKYDENILDPVFLDFDPPRKRMKEKYGVDFLIAGVNVGVKGLTTEEFFQIDRDGNPKGILLLEF